MLELLIVPVCFVIFVTYLMCSLYIEQHKYYKYHHPTEDDMNENNNCIINDKYSDSEEETNEEETNEEEISEEEINEEEINEEDTNEEEISE